MKEHILALIIKNFYTEETNMKLYIIGNGVDLAHGLKTWYWEFRKFLEYNHPEFLLLFEKLYNIEALDDSEPWYTEEMQKRWDKSVDHALWSTFEEKIGTPNVQSMLDMFETVISGMDSEMIECGIKDTMDVYWKEEYGYIKKLQKYVKEWIEEIDLSEIKPKKESLINNGEDYFFNFNYTNVIEEIYNIENVIHIHGSVGKQAMIEPFMGHCNKGDIQTYRKLADDTNEEYNDAESSVCDEVADYLEAIYKDTSYFIKFYEYYFEKLNSVDEIIIFGWSAGDVDIPYLCKIRDSISKDTRWRAYFYDNEAKEKSSLRSSKIIFITTV